MNPAYKHLADKFRWGELTIGQWVVVVVSVAAAGAWALYLSPFGATVTVIAATYIAGPPALVALVAGHTEFDFWAAVGDRVRHLRHRARHLPGPGGQARGYAITPDPRERRGDASERPPLELEGLWTS